MFFYPQYIIFIWTERSVMFRFVETENLEKKDEEKPEATENAGPKEPEEQNEEIESVPETQKPEEEQPSNEAGEQTGTVEQSQAAVNNGDSEAKKEGTSDQGETGETMFFILLHMCMSALHNVDDQVYMYAPFGILITL